MSRQFLERVDPLKEVIVGTAQHAADVGYEPALSPYACLESESRAIAGGGHASARPRDLLLVIGDEIIEVPMSQRARFFEYRAYRTLIKGYFRGGARWTAAPKPLRSANLYHPPGAEPFDYRNGPLLTEHEPAFDAACFARCGRDIFWQPDLVSNDFGAQWLERHLGPDFRVHKLRFDEKLTTHIDTTLVPLRPGMSSPTRRGRAAIRSISSNGTAGEPLTRRRRCEQDVPRRAMSVTGSR